MRSPNQEVQEVPAEELGSCSATVRELISKPMQGQARALLSADADRALCVSDDAGTEGYAYDQETSPHPLEEARFSRHIHHRATVTDLNHLLTKAAFSKPPGGLSPWALAS